MHRFVNTRVTRASCNHIRETILYKRLEEVRISRDTIKLGTPVYLHVYQKYESFEQKEKRMYIAL